MVIENRLPKSRKAQALNPLGPLSQSNGGDRLCRRHQFSHVVETPVRIGVLAGVQIRATEAERTSQSHYPAFGPRDQGRSRHDVPQLPGRLREGWQAPRWTTALPLQSVREEIQRP